MPLHWQLQNTLKKIISCGGLTQFKLAESLVEKFNVVEGSLVVLYQVKSKYTFTK